VATACSGTDGVMLVLSDLLGERLLHLWSCEKDEKKRGFILSMLGNRATGVRLFKNILDLHKLVAEDAVSGQLQEVQPVDAIFLGFVCKDRSPQNAKRKRYENCIEEEGDDDGPRASTTGATFNSMIRLLKVWKAAGTAAALLFLENTASLGDRNLHAVVAAFATIGYVCKYDQMGPTSYFFPTTRPRVYFVAMDVEQFAPPRGLSASSPPSLEECLSAVFADLRGMGNALESLSTFLLDDAAPLVLSATELGRRKFEKCKDSELLGPVDAYLALWPNVHRPVFEAQGFEFRPVLHEGGVGNCGYRGPRDDASSHAYAALTDREKNILQYFDLLMAAHPELRAKITNVDLSQSLARVQCIGHVTKAGQSELVSAISCILPGGKVWLFGPKRDKSRLLRGVEKMALQGIPMDAYPYWEFNEMLLSDLAGNMFNLGCMGAVFSSTLMNVALRSRDLRPLRIPRPRIP
jgi:hypothetical protein